MEDNKYQQIGVVFGSIVAFLVFFGSWIYCMAEYGFLFGFGLGWLPAGIAAYISFFMTCFLWPFVALGLLWMLIQLM